MKSKNAGAMIGHVGVEVASISKSRKFYSALLANLGFDVILENENTLGFSNLIFQIWLAKPQKLRVKRESPSGEEFIVADHLAILAESREAVDAVEREMSKSGFAPLFPCEEHPEFCPGY